MATPYSGPQHTITLVASDDLSARQYHVMRFVGENKVGFATSAATSTLLGLLQNKPKLGEHATIADQGVSYAIAGGAVTAGVLVTTNASGRVTAAASGNFTIGRALTEAGGDGETISVELDFPSRLPL